MMIVALGIDMRSRVHSDGSMSIGPNAAESTRQRVRRPKPLSRATDHRYCRPEAAISSCSVDRLTVYTESAQETDIRSLLDGVSEHAVFQRFWKDARPDSFAPSAELSARRTTKLR